MPTFQENLYCVCMYLTPLQEKLKYDDTWVLELVNLVFCFLSCLWSLGRTLEMWPLSSVHPNDYLIFIKNSMLTHRHKSGHRKSKLTYHYFIVNSHNSLPLSQQGSLLLHIFCFFQLSWQQWIPWNSQSIEVIASTQNSPSTPFGRKEDLGKAFVFCLVRLASQCMGSS